MPGAFQNFIAGEQAGFAIKQQQFQNQLAQRQQAMVEQESQQRQAALAEQRRFNQLLAPSFGQDTVDTLGVPLTGGPPAQAQMPAQMQPQPQPQQMVDESQGPPQYPQAFAQPSQGLPASLPSLGDSAPLPLSQLVAINPELAFKAEEARRAKEKQDQTTVYNVTHKSLEGKGSKAAALKYLLATDNINGLNIKGFREQLRQQGFNVDNPTEEEATQLMTRLRDKAASIILPPAKPETTDDIREYERAKSEGDTRTFAQYMVDMKRAGASNTNVNLPETKYPNKFAEGLAESDVKRLETFMKAADSSRALSQTLEELGELNETALQGGGAKARVEIANWVKGLTGSDLIDPKVLAGSQKYNALIAKSILDSLGGSLGVGVSNSDVAFMEKTVPQLEYSQQARTDMIQFMKRRARQNVLLYDDARAYAENNKGLKRYHPPKTATNKATGAKMIKIDGEWIDLDAVDGDAP